MHQAKLHHYDTEEKRSGMLSEILASAEAVIAMIDNNELAAHYGLKLIPGDQSLAKLRKEKDVEKETLIDALTRQARALGDLKKEDEFKLAFKSLQQWADVDDNTFIYVGIQNDLSTSHYGLALKVYTYIIFNLSFLLLS